MKRLIRASLAVPLVLWFINLGGGAASDPIPLSHRHPEREAPLGTGMPPAAAAMLSPSATATTVPFTATAYCQSGKTRSGAKTHPGVAAGDPAHLPVGSVVRVETDKLKYSGIYTVLDTGGKIQGKKLDLFMHDCHEARQFGKQPVRVTVLRKGWSPRTSAPKAGPPEVRSTTEMPDK